MRDLVHKKNPGTIIAIQGILKSRLILMACLLIAVGFIAYYPVDSVFTNRLMEILFKYSGGRNTGLDNSTDLFYFLIGINLPTAFIIIFEYDFLIRKKAIGFWILFALDFLFGLATRVILFQAIILILALMKSSRTYLQKEQTKNITHILDEDILNENN